MSLQQVFPSCKHSRQTLLLLSAALHRRETSLISAQIYKTIKLFSLFDLSDALEKMKGVYAQNPQMGDPSSLEPQISETAQNIGRLKGELGKYEVDKHTDVVQSLCNIWDKDSSFIHNTSWDSY